MKQEVLNCLPKSLRTSSMRDDLDHLLFVRTWPAEFEFAHFTNTELARAIKSVTPGAPPEREIRRSLSSCRENGGPIKSVWANWTHRPSKIAMAEAAWPALERRIRGGRQRVPIVELLREVLQIAANARRAREMAPQDRR